MNEKKTNQLGKTKALPNTTRKVWVVLEEEIGRELPQKKQWGYSDWEIYHG